MNWILCGFKGSGKTYFGQRLGLPFIDTDQLLEREEGLPIRELAQHIGISAFRKREQLLLESLNIEGHIIATGGGMILSPLSVSLLKALGKLIFLCAPKSLIQKRLLTNPLPSFLDPQDPLGSFEKMWSTRNPEYERICDFKVILEGKSDDQVLEELWRVINLERSFASPHGASLMEKPLES